MASEQNANTSKVDLTWLERYRCITVIGLGISGVGVVKALTQNGFTLHIQDSRKKPAGLEQIRDLKGVKSVYLGGFDVDALLKSDLLIVSPGVSLKTPEIRRAIDAGVDISGDIDIVSRSIDIPIIAITGSNGKSTVTQLAGEVCQLAGYNTFIGGNIGLSAMELFNAPNTYELAVLELSSFQLETTKELAADNAVVLNLSADHLDRYDSFQEYALTKLLIYTKAKNLVWNRDDKWFQKMDLLKNSKEMNAVCFGLDEPKHVNEFGIIEDDKGNKWLAKGGHKIVPAEIGQLLGEHNQANFLAVMALLDHMDIDKEVFKQAFIEFSGLPHRMQTVRKKDGVVWINDSKATNIGATYAAIEGLKKDIILIAGGQAKGADLSELLPVLKQYVCQIYVFGEDAEKIYQAWHQYISCYRVKTLESAIIHVDEIAKSGQYVLFAPACASFDMFENFAVRGERFIELVNAL